jgi:hypothetical protein
MGVPDFGVKEGKNVSASIDTLTNDSFIKNRGVNDLGSVVIIIILLFL